MTTTKAPSYCLQFAKVDVWEVAVEKDVDDQGVPFEYEYEVPVDPRPVGRRIEAEVGSYREAKDLAKLAIKFPPGPANAVSVTVSDGTGRNFITTGYQRLTEAIESLRGY